MCFLAEGLVVVAEADWEWAEGLVEALAGEPGVLGNPRRCVASNVLENTRRKS